MAKIERALLSVSNKNGIIDFAKQLSEYGIEILSTGGTAKILRDAGLKITEVSEYTGFPEMMDGRVKTLHPKIHGGLLSVRTNPEHQKSMIEHGIKKIDLVVINLYPFRETISMPGATFEQAIENIDIGGPAMLRSSAKNFEFVTVITDPEDYALVLTDMQKTGGEVSRETNYKLAMKVFENTSSYDGAIAEYLKSKISSN